MNERVDILDRTEAYALRAIKVYQALQKEQDGAGWVIGKQYLRAATSIGANVAEAQHGESRADFIHKYSIAQKEARESLYWLNLLSKSSILPANRLQSLIQETNELISIITTIILRAKQNNTKTIHA